MVINYYLLLDLLLTSANYGLKARSAGNKL